MDSRTLIRSVTMVLFTRWPCSLLERHRVLAQARLAVSDPELAKQYSIFSAMEDEGPAALFVGAEAGTFRAFLHHAILMLVCKKIWHPPQGNGFIKCLHTAICQSVTHVILQPLGFLRVWLLMPGCGVAPHGLRDLWIEHGFTGLYRGAIASLCTNFFYALVQAMLYDQLRTRFSLGTVGDLLIHGTCSAIVGQLVAWPFDMIRRWYMRSGCEIISNEMNSQQVGVDTKGKSMLQVSRYLYTRHGLGGFWQPASMLPGIAKMPLGVTLYMVSFILTAPQSSYIQIAYG